MGHEVYQYALEMGPLVLLGRPLRIPRRQSDVEWNPIFFC